MFTKKRYLITGASSGIGEGFARELHARGADLVISARREDRLKALASELNRKRASSVTACVADLGLRSESKGIDRLIALCNEEQIDGLINNAGFGSFGEFSSLDIDSEWEMFRINVHAPMLLTHAVLPQMKERREGVIVNIASIASFHPLPFMASYSATKAALLQLSLAHSYELKGSGVQVTAVCPGPVPTEFGKVAKYPGTGKRMVGDPISDVVRASLLGIQKGKRIVVPGFWGKVLSGAIHLAPKVISLPVSHYFLSRLVKK